MRIILYKILSVLCVIGAVVSAFVSFPLYDTGGDTMFGGLKGYDFFKGFLLILVSLVLIALAVMLYKRAKRWERLSRYTRVDY